MKRLRATCDHLKNWNFDVFDLLQSCIISVMDELDWLQTSAGEATQPEREFVVNMELWVYKKWTKTSGGRNGDLLG